MSSINVCKTGDSYVKRHRMINTSKELAKINAN
jgi:hypothetical protein